MQVRVLGAHNLEDTESRHTCFLVDGVLGIDAGSLAGALTSAQQREVRALLLTHEDFDHARDVPTLGLATLDSPGAIEVFGLRETLESVREHLMDDRLYPDLTKGLNGALVLVKPTQDSEALRAAYRVTNVVSRQQEQFEFRRTVTQVALDTGDDLSAFDLRTTRVLVQAEPHELFQEQ
ncbi:MAG: MBL fold metallo-hydrolase, partial [SAR202 cluster bacterium]|nr:MBL fold metallo-hydrolase [SAR202 cluster bacterium]